MKKRFIGVSFFVLLLLLIQGQLFAGIGPNVVENDSIAAVYFNVGKLYEILRQQLTAINTGDAKVKSQVANALSNIGKENPFGKDLSLDDLTTFADNWHKDANFIPTGGIWLSFSKDMKPRVVIEADSKLDKVAEFLKEGFGSQVDYQPKKKMIEYSLSNLDLAMKITPKHVTIGKISEKAIGLNNSWRTFLRYATSPNQLLALELDMQGIFEAMAMQQRGRGSASHRACASNMRILQGSVEMYNMDNSEMMTKLEMDKLIRDSYIRAIPTCPQGGTYSATGDLSVDGEVVCSVHNTVDNLKEDKISPQPVNRAQVIERMPDPRLQHLVRLRIFAGANGLLVGAAINDEKVRQEGKEAMTQGLTVFEQQIQQAPDTEQTQLIKNLLKNVEHVDKAPWLGFLLKADSSDQTQVMLVSATIGTLAAIAIPNFVKARQQARQKACFANQRVLLGAIELYNIDNDEMLSTIDMEAIVKGGYLRRPVTCIEGGTYISEGNLAGDDGKIKCTIHGSVYDH